MDEARLTLLPVRYALRVVFGQLEAAAPVAADDFLEVRHALDEELLVALAVGREVPEATLVEMLGHHAADVFVVAADERSAAGEVRGAELDGGQARGGDEPGGLRAEGTGEDAVAVPVLQPGRRRGVQGAELKVGRPRAVGRHVAPDSGKELARVGAGGLDEEGDPRGAAMGRGGHGDDQKPYF